MAVARDYKAMGSSWDMWEEMVMPPRFTSWTGWSGFLRSRLTRPRLPTVRHTWGLRMTAHRVSWSASVR